MASHRWTAAALLLGLAAARKKPADEGDDSPMLFFLLAILSCILLPWTFVVVWYLIFPGQKEVAKAFPKTTESGHLIRQCKTQAMETRRQAEISRLTSRHFSAGFVFRLVILILLWFWLIYISSQVRHVLQTSSLYANFDPHYILEVSSYSSTADIKKAYRKLSLKYHPDKNPGASAEQFMLIKKAYDALTDPQSKRNYELYGNPDGPSRMEMGMALPTVSKEHQGIVLVIFLVLFIIGVPLMMLWCMTGSGLDANGLHRSVNETLAAGLSARMDFRGIQELVLGACASERPALLAEALEGMREELRSAGAPFRSTKSGKKAKAGGDEEGKEPIALLRSEALLWAHLLRRTDLLDGSPLAAELENDLPRWQAAVRMLMAAAAKTGAEDATMASLDFYRSLVQAIDASSASRGGSSSLLQIPHFSAERIKLWRKGPRKNAGLLEFLRLQPDERRKSLEAEDLGFDAQERADIDEFVAVAPQLQVVEAKVFVQGEDEICAHDVATLRLRLLRSNIRESEAPEAAGAAHTPFFPGAQVPEAWWVSFNLPGKGRTCVFSRMLDASREAVTDIRFRVPIAGKCRLRLTLTCEAYAGLDLEHDVSFVAKQAPAPADSDDDREIDLDEGDVEFDD